METKTPKEIIEYIDSKLKGNTVPLDVETDAIKMINDLVDLKVSEEYRDKIVEVERRNMEIIELQDKHSKYIKTIIGSYYRYGNIEDEKIREHLSKIKVVKKQHKGVNSIYGYYSLNDKSMEKILKGPRKSSLTFDAAETEDSPTEGLSEYKTITFLVKSTSRFFLKPDIGEIFDQIYHMDLLHDKIKAICINEGYECLDETDGEHFLMTATLLH